MQPEIVFIAGLVTGSLGHYALGALGEARQVQPPAEPASSERQLETWRLAAENAALSTQMADVRDRLANIERIVTDGSYELGEEIEQLRTAAN